MVDKVRDKALNILSNIYNGAYSNIELNKELENSAFDTRDRAFITEIVYGTLKATITLDYIIKSKSKIKDSRIAPKIKNVLRMGLYQMFFMDRVPDSAVVNESVKLAGRYGHEGTKRFVNGLLRNVLRDVKAVKENNSDKSVDERLLYLEDILPDKTKDPVTYLSVKYGYQEWITKRYLKQHDFDFVESMFIADSEDPDFIIRVNRLKTTKAELIDKLDQRGIESYPCKFCDEALHLVKPSAVKNINEFNDGLFNVQGESSMLVAKALDPKTGENILDMCSAPGGKTTHIAELMGNEGHVVANDIFPHKIELINEAAARLGISIVDAAIGDATVFNKDYEESFDRVLVDAPCSGLGIVRKKPDIKLSRKKEDIKGLVDVQKAILNNAARYVKPGGVVVYSTCTILDEENYDVVSDFIEKNKNFEFMGFEKLLPQYFSEKNTADSGYLHLFSNMNGIEGFFIAKLKRIN